MKKTKLLVAFLACLSFTLVLAPHANAVRYIYNPYGYHYATVVVDNSNYLFSPYTSLSNAAIASWNNCNLTVRSISTNSNSTNKIYADQDLEEAWSGQYLQLIYDSSYAQTRSYFTTKFKITLNANLMEEENYPSNQIQGIIAHELGHSLGLAHNDDGVEAPYTLMRTSDINCITNYTPKTYDVNAVNAGWPCYGYTEIN